MKAGFAKIRITPPLGSLMYGWGDRDLNGCTAIHDDLFVRALYAEQDGEPGLILSYDLLFFSRAHADRYKGALGRFLDLTPRQILLHTTHTHLGPMLGMGQWAHADFLPPDRLYLDQIERATNEAARQAREGAREATLWAGKTRTSLPMSRRKLDENGIAKWEPNPEGEIYDALPFCLFKDAEGKAICLLFSVSCHPSTVKGTEISADYPGVAMNLLDDYLGITSSLFLQGAGGETKPSVSVKGNRFEGDWGCIKAAGEMVANAVIAAMKNSLVPVEPEIRTSLVELSLPLQPSSSRESYRAIADDAGARGPKRKWAQRQIDRLDRQEKLPQAASLLLQGIQLGRNLRLIAVEAEVLAPLGALIDRFYTDGITFPLGYSNGTAFYLPTSQMIEKEGGYEVNSFWEYGLPAGLDVGVENILVEGLKRLGSARSL